MGFQFLSKKWMLQHNLYSSEMLKMEGMNSVSHILDALHIYIIVNHSPGDVAGSYTV